MRKNLLLSSTAIVGAGVLLTSAQPALADIELTISGQVEFGVVGASDDTLLNTERDRNYLFFMDSEINFNADGVTDSGLNYGAKVELEVDVDVDDAILNDGGNNADEVGVYFSGGWGRVEMGRDDGAEDVMFVGGEDAQAGTGGIDGDTQNLTVVQIQDTGDAAKATYFTPRLAGFQLGASWTPDTGDEGIKNNNNFEKDLGFGVNWVGGLGPVDLTLAAVGDYANREQDGTGQTGDNKKDWSVGALGEWGGFTFGAAGGQRKGFQLAGEDNDTDFANVGIKYGWGPANVSVGYNWASFDSIDNQNVYAVSGDIGLLPGVVLKADVTYNDEDPFNDSDDIGDTDNTTSGVLSVQVNY